MTADTHERASDRTAEAMLQIEDIMNEKVDIIVMAINAGQPAQLHCFCTQHRYKSAKKYIFDRNVMNILVL